MTPDLQLPTFGQLQSMTSSAATVNYGSYDVLGRMGSNTQTTSGNAYTFQYTYRLNDSISSMQYPSGKTVNYAVDDAGRVNQVTAGTKTYADLTASSAPFTADGRIAQMKLGNDLWETRSYQTPGTPTLLKLGTAAGSQRQAGIGIRLLGNCEQRESGDASHPTTWTHLDAELHIRQSQSSGHGGRSQWLQPNLRL